MKNEKAEQVRKMLVDLRRAGLTVKDIARHTDLSDYTIKVYSRKEPVPNRTQGKIVTAVRALHDKIIVRREALQRPEHSPAITKFSLPETAQGAYEAAAKWDGVPTWPELTAAARAQAEATYACFRADVRARDAVMRLEMVEIGSD
jgi:hypothetical protein